MNTKWKQRFKEEIIPNIITGIVIITIILGLATLLAYAEHKGW